MLDPEENYPKVKNIIYSLMLKYGVSSQNREDMLQACYLGYLKALKTYKRGKSSLTTWCFYAIRKELQQFCKLYYATSGFSNHRNKVMPKEKITGIEETTSVTNRSPIDELIDKEYENAIKDLLKKNLIFLDLTFD